MIKFLSTRFKMKNILVFLVLVFLVSCVSASDVTYTIVGDKVLVDISSEDSGVIFLPEDYSMLEVGGEYELIGDELFLEEGEVSFISEDYAKKINGEWLFVSPVVVSLVSDVRLYLPQGYVLSDGLVYPKDYVVSSDGQNIILEWKDFDSEEIVVFYKGVSDSDLVYYFVIGVLILVGMGVLYLERKKFMRKIKKIQKVRKKAEVKLKKSKKSVVTKNLFGDEKEIVEYLLGRKGKSCWTKELVKELGISKVRLSRKIRSLVEKGLVEREKFGNENRISLR